MESLRGSLLLAGGTLLDPNFRRSVVLIAEHGEEGALGLILNRPAEVSVETVVPSLALLVETGSPLFLGGPVAKDTVIALAEFEGEVPTGRPVLGSIAFAPLAEEPDLLVGIRRARVFAGYAGWGPGQLEAELAESAWIVEPARPDDVFTPEPLRLWSSVLRRKGGEFAMLALMPHDPSSN